MKILIPVFGFAASGGGRVLSELANQWILSGHEVTFISFADSDKPYFPTNANIIWINYKEIQMDSNNLNHKNYPLRYFFIRNSLKRAIDKFGNDFDIVLATHSFTARPVYLSSIKAKKFYYIQAHETEYYSVGGIKHIFYKIAAKASYGYNLLRIVNSELYLNYKEIKANMFVYPGMDLKKYYPKKTTVYQNKEKLIIGCIGRIQKIKGTQLVLDAFNILKNQNVNIELHIAFGNKEYANIEGIKIITPKSDDELADFYRSVDVIVAPMTVQLGAIHYPVLEAFACGTSVITTGYSKADEINSYIVKINDVNSIVESINMIMKDPETAQKKAELAKEVLPDFAWDVVSNKMLSYFEKSLNN